MNNSIKQSIKAITEGAIFTAIYGILAIISRYLLMGTDSLLYYFTPLPISLYIAKNKLSYSITVLFASILLSFLFADPIITALVIAPNIIVGFIFGIVEKFSNVKLINFLFVFLSCLVTSCLGIYAYQLITNVGYFDDIIPFVGKVFELFGINNSSLIKAIVEITSFATIIVDAAIKTLLLYMLFVLIVKRLKLIKDYNFKVNLMIKFNLPTAIIYIIVLTSFLYIFSLLNIYDNIILKFINIILVSVLFLYSSYLIYQFVMFLRFKFKSLKMYVFVFIILFSFMLFPISIGVALILNFINYNILKDMFL